MRIFSEDNNRKTAKDQPTTDGRIVRAEYELDTTKAPQLGLSVRIAVGEGKVVNTRRMFFSSVDTIVELLSTCKPAQPISLVGKAITVYGPASYYYGFSIKNNR